MGTSEILLILLAVLVLFGADKLPEFARSIGKGMREVQKATDEIRKEIIEQTNTLKEEVEEVKSTLNTTEINPIDQMKKEIDETLTKSGE